MNMILLLFIILASMFLASSVDNLAAVSGAIDHFLDMAKVPDSIAIALLDGEQDGLCASVAPFDRTKYTAFRRTAA